MSIELGLSRGASGPSVGELQAALTAIGLEIDVAEREGNEFGPSTAAAIARLQAISSLPETGEIDAATLAAISAAMKRLGVAGGGDGQAAGNERSIGGTVTDTDGLPLGGATVVGFDCGLRDTNEIGRAETDSRGAYRIAYPPGNLPAGNGAADVKVEVLAASGEPLFTSLIMFHAPPELTINVALGGPQHDRPSELSSLAGTVSPLLGNLEPAELQENDQHHDLSFLAGGTGIAEPRLAFWTIAERLAQTTELPPELFYALLRSNVPADGQTLALATSAQGVDLDGNAQRLLDAILATSPATLKGALENAIASNTVPASYADRAQDDLASLATLATKATLSSSRGFGRTSLGDVFGTLGLDSASQERFAALYAAATGSPGKFWSDLEANPDFTPAQVADFRFGVTVGRLTRGHLPLIEELAAERRSGQITHARDLARLTADDWAQLLRKPVGGAPIGVLAGFKAATPGQSIQQYAAMLERNFTTAYPTVAFSTRLARDPKPAFTASRDVAAYLDANPAFDLRFTNIDAYARNAPMSAEVRSTLLAAQRLAKLNPDYTVMSALMSDGIHSARQVYAMGSDQFAARYGSLPALGPAAANRAYAQAEQTYGMALALATEFNAALTGASPAAAADMLATVTPGQLDGFPTLQTLFGSDSWCACSDCQSVLGAPAYLADTLEFLSHRPASGGQSARDVLLARRPDLAQIELSCPNTNTELPYIDLVNELLEDAVAPPPPSPPPARKRQTTLSTTELNANPQYVNNNAYSNLAAAVYPWTLPFDLPLAEARTYLGQIGLDRAGLIRMFQKPDGYPVSSAQARQIAAETLGLTALEADIVTAGALAAGNQPCDYWGLQRTGNRITDPYDPTRPLTGTWIGLLSQARVLLNRAGLTYQELARLLNTVFINGDSGITITCDPNSCDVASMTIDWGTKDTDAITDILQRIHRFTRLWRRLGWDVYDLDDAIAILQNANPPGLARLNDQLLRQLATIVALTNQYPLAVREAVALFVTTPGYASIPTRDVPALPGDDIKYSLYHDLFQNLTILNPPDPAFAPIPAGSKMKIPQLADHTAVLVAGLQVTQADVQLAIATFTDGLLTPANLSAIYRNVKLAAILGLTLQQLIRLLAIAEAPASGSPGYEQVNPFDGTRPESVLTFAGIVDMVRASNLSIEQIDYLVRDNYDAASGVAPDPVMVGTLLLNLRNGLLKITADTTPVADPSGTVTRTELAKLLSPSDVDAVMGILDGINQPPATPDPASFLANKLGTYIDAAAAAADVVDPGALLHAGEQRFEYLLGNLLGYERSTRSTVLIVQTLAQSLGLPTATTALLVKDWLPSADTPGARAIADFLALPDLTLTDTTDPIPPDGSGPDAAGFAACFTTYTALAKTALIVTTLNLSADDVTWWHDTGAALGWLDPTTLPTSATSTAEGRFQQLNRIAVAAKLRSVLPTPGTSFGDLFAGTSTSTTPKLDYLNELTALTQWPLDALTVLCGDPANTGDTGMLSLTWPDDYRSEAALQRLTPAMGTITRTGIPADVSAWTATTLTADTADTIKQAVKGRYPTPQWLALAKQLRDPLRQAQRDALVAYLLANPPPQGVTRWLDPDDVFGYFLIDVEMCACMATSRIVQATAAVQLFVQRCFLDLESPAVAADVKADADWAQWQWMSQYRLWQANREVFLFPENWIDPGLRANKSSFFADLEQQLKQADVTGDTAEAALSGYLEKLEQVARLDVCGTYHDLENGQDVLYVLARTQGSPPVYYMRKWVGSWVWTPWEKVDLDIASDHVLPVIWNGKRYMFWAITNVKPDQSNQTIQAAGPNATYKHLEVQLAWSQYKQGKWQAKQTAPQTLVFQAFGNPDPPTSPDLTLRSVFDGSVLQVNAFLPEDPGFWAHAAAFRLGGTGTGVEAFIDPSWADLSQVGGPEVAGVGTLQVYAPEIGAPGLSDFDGDWIEADPLYNLNYLPSSLRRVSQLYTSYSYYGSLNSELVLNQADYYRLVVPHQTPDFDSSLPFFYRDPAREYFIVPTPYYQNDNYFTTTAPPYVYHPFYRAEYQFYSFYHPFAGLLVSQLNGDGVDALFNRDLQRNPAAVAGTPAFNFGSYYQPTSLVVTPYPAEGIDFGPHASYALYNWELFYHAPFLIAKVLSAHQRFDLAKHWYEYVFNPAGPATNADGTTASVPQRYWITKPFYGLQARDYADQQLTNLMQLINNHNTDLDNQVAAWRSDPFDPDMIAQLRLVAYQRAIVMSYIDNLISWGDQLFTQDTRESVNLATQLYVLAGQLLGPRPEIVPPPIQPTVMTYADLVATGTFDDFANATVAAENVIPPVQANVPPKAGTPKLPSLLYFRIPPNTQLLGYWDTVAGRLFKIRHCMNIEGTVQQLPLFAPPISPGLLVAAAAAGLDLASVLSDSNVALPPYRFRTMIRHAIELCELVRGLGAELLAALEKSDAEALARIRSGAERDIQKAIADVRAREIDAAQQEIAVLGVSKQAFIDKANFYVGRSLMNDWEVASLIAKGVSLIPQIVAGYLEAGAAVLNLLPVLNFGVTGPLGTPTATANWGGSNVGSGLSSAAGAAHTIAAVVQTGAEMAAVLGGHHQRKDSWDLEGTVAQDEMARIDAETLAAQIRSDIASKQKAAQDKSVKEAADVDDFLHSKFTDQELYDWMVGQTATTYFQAYQLAYTTAKQAEQCFRRELAITDGSYVQFGYWDSLRKGLTAGDKLLYDLRRLESAYYTQNVRELEITKHVSLLQTDPYALVELRNTGTCTVTLPEISFDLDNPGHYMRRLKHVAVTVPCVVGPYGGVSMTLTLLDNKIRTSATDPQSPPDLDDPGGTSQIVTSSAQNDAGYDPSADDDRYQPFYGSGAISAWRITLNNFYPQFDYSTITDVVLHLRYTARDGGNAFRTAVKNDLQSKLNAIALAESRRGLYRLISARHEYPTEWATFLNPPAGSDQVLTLETPPERFPFFTNGMNIKVAGVDVIARTADTSDYALVITPPGGTAQTLTFSPDPTLSPSTFSAEPTPSTHHVSAGPFQPPAGLGRAPTPSGSAPPAWTIKLKKAGAADYRSLTQDDLDDLVLVVSYTVTP